MRTPVIPRSWYIGIALLYLLIVAYAVVVPQQIFLGVVGPLLVAAVVYILWRLWRVFRLYEQQLEESAQN